MVTFRSTPRILRRKLIDAFVFSEILGIGFLLLSLSLTLLGPLPGLLGVRLGIYHLKGNRLTFHDILYKNKKAQSKEGVNQIVVGVALVVMGSFVWYWLFMKCTICFE